MQEEVSAARHLVLAQIGHDKFLAVKFVSALHASGKHRMALRRIAADDQYQACVLNVADGAGIATVPDCAKQPRGRRRLAIAGAVIDVIRTDHGARQFLHQIALFIGALRRRNERERVWTVLRFNLSEFTCHQIESLVPTGLAEPVALTDQRCGQTIRIIDIVPTELAFDAGGDPVRRPIRRFHLKDVAVLGPYIEAATHAAIRAHGFGAADARLPHRCFHLGHLQDEAVSTFGFDALDYVNHPVHGRSGNPRQKSRVSEHGLFHEGIARANGHAVAAGHATGFADGRTAVPQHARVRILPIDGEGLVHFEVLTGLYTAPAKDALIRIVTVKGICIVDFVGLVLERNLLVLNP